MFRKIKSLDKLKQRYCHLIGLFQCNEQLLVVQYLSLHIFTNYYVFMLVKVRQFFFCRLSGWIYTFYLFEAIEYFNIPLSLENFGRSSGKSDKLGELGFLDIQHMANCHHCHHCSYFRYIQHMANYYQCHHILYIFSIWQIIINVTMSISQWWLTIVDKDRGGNWWPVVMSRRSYCCILLFGFCERSSLSWNNYLIHVKFHIKDFCPYNIHFVPNYLLE